LLEWYFVYCARALSFIVYIYISTSGTCSLHAVILSIMPIPSTGSVLQNCRSPCMCLILNPLALYVLIICLIDIMMVDFFHF